VRDFPDQPKAYRQGDWWRFLFYDMLLDTIKLIRGDGLKKKLNWLVTSLNLSYKRWYQKEEVKSELKKVRTEMLFDFPVDFVCLRKYLEQDVLIELLFDCNTGYTNLRNVGIDKYSFVFSSWGWALNSVSEKDRELRLEKSVRYFFVNLKQVPVLLNAEDFYVDVVAESEYSENTFDIYLAINNIGKQHIKEMRKRNKERFKNRRR